MTNVDRSYQAIVQFLEQAVAEAGADEGRLRAVFDEESPSLDARVRKEDGEHPVALPGHIQADLSSAVTSIYRTLRQGRPWDVVDFTVKKGTWSMNVTR